MEIPARQTSAWSPASLPDALTGTQTRAVLLFGPDTGGGVEMAAALCRAGGGDVHRTPAQGARAADLAALLGAATLFGPAAWVRLEGATDAHHGLVADLLERPFAHGARLVITAGDLKKTSKLRKLFAGRDDCVSGPLYLLGERERTAFARKTLEALGTPLAREAAGDIAAWLSGDRALAARACEALSLHALGRVDAAARVTRETAAARVTREDIAAVLAPVDERGIAEPIEAALDGDAAAASRAFAARLAAGESHVGMARIFAQRLFRLREIAAMHAAGTAPRDAVARAKPPVFWADKARREGQVRRWRPEAIDTALAAIDAAEQDTMDNALPPEVRYGQALFDIAALAGR